MAHHMDGVERNPSTTRERTGRLRLSTKQPPEEEAAHRMDRTEWRQTQWQMAGLVWESTHGTIHRGLVMTGRSVGAGRQGESDDGCLFW